MLEITLGFVLGMIFGASAWALLKAFGRMVLKWTRGLKDKKVLALETAVDKAVAKALSNWAPTTTTSAPASTTTTPMGTA